MNQQDWTRIEALFHQAIALPASERANFLEEARVNDPALITEVMQLLDADARAGAFIEDAVIHVANHVDASQPPWEASFEGKTIGAYRLIRELGHGGMSLVYLAVREDVSFEQKVAVKVIRWEMDTEEIRRRFRKEMSILASLDHPNIARLYDGGAGPDGLPYLVMEYIEGVPLDQYCDQNRLSITRRTELFLKVCDAVEYAHRNLVLHLDLKPNNILVTEEGVPKLLDFGTSKLLRPDPFFHTQERRRPMTPGYASPEQMRDGPLTTSSDVYSLGVLLYGLLSGLRPYEFTDHSQRDMETVVCEIEPRLASIAVADAEKSGQAMSTIYHDRRCDGKQLVRRLQGDYDNILRQALQKSPKRRYETTSHLSEDLRRHLQGFPVKATPYSMGYRTVKFVRRHWLGVGAFAAFLLMLIGFIITQSIASQKLKHERDFARKLDGYLQTVMEIADPEVSRRNPITGKKLLDRMAKVIIEDPTNKPETLAMLLGRLAKMYHAQDLFTEAADMYQRQIVILERVGGRQAELGDIWNWLGNVLSDSGDLEEGERAYLTSLTLKKAVYGDTHPKVTIGYNNLALIYHEKGEYERAGPLMETVVRLDCQDFGENDPETACSRNSMAGFYYDMAAYEKAEILLNDIGRILKDHRSDYETYYWRHRELAGLTAFAQGRFTLSHALLTETLAHFRERFGESNRDVARLQEHLGLLAMENGRYGEAEQLLESAHAAKIKVLGNQHISLASSLESLGWIHYACGDDAASLAEFMGALELYEQAYARDHPKMGWATAGLGAIFYRWNSPDLALDHLERGLSLIPEGDWRNADPALLLSECLIMDRNLDQALPLLEKTSTAISQRFGPNHPKTASAYNRLAELSPTSSPSTSN